MTISEKIRFSADKAIFTLFREGLFYKCYNEDAMVFSQRVKNYKVTSKIFKGVGAKVLSLGFPVSEVSTGKLSFDVLCKTLGAEKHDEKTEKVTFYLKDNIKEGYESWHENVVKENTAQYSYQTTSSKPKKNEAYRTEIVTMIKNYDLANSTPIQGLNFIQQLKMEIQKIEGSNGDI